MTEAAKPDLTGIYLEAHNDSLFEPEDQKFGRVLSIEEAAQALRIGPSVLEGEIGFSRLGTVALREVRRTQSPRPFRVVPEHLLRRFVANKTKEARNAAPAS